MRHDCGVATARCNQGYNRIAGCQRAPDFLALVRDATANESLYGAGTVSASEHNSRPNLGPSKSLDLKARVAFVPRSSGDQMSKRTKRSHPTRDALITTVLELLETTNPDDIKVHEVLEKSGISVGSLYHHFDDLSDLIDQAMIGRYAEDVDARIDALSQIVQGAHDKKTLMEGFSLASRVTHAPDRSSVRFYRAQTMTRAVTHEQFRAALAVEQKKLTDAIADLFHDLQQRGLFTAELDAQAASMFIQAYSLGFIVNDISVESVDHDAYVALLDRMVERLFFAE